MKRGSGLTEQPLMATLLNAVRWTAGRVLTNRQQLFTVGARRVVQPRALHTTAVRAFNPGVYVAAEMVIVAAFSRLSRRYWSTNRLGPIVKKIGLGMLGVVAILTILLAYVYQKKNSKKNPITGRKQFLSFGSSDVDCVSRENESAIQRNRFLSIHSPEWMRLRRIVNSILKGNVDVEEIKDMQLDVHVIDSVERNAFTLPNGHTYITRGLMNNLQSDDDLAFLIASEIAHAALNHGKERNSNQQLVDWFSLTPVLGIWLLRPFNKLGRARNAPHVIATIIYFMVTQAYARRPYNETMELEADKLAAELTTKACYNIKSGINFLSKSRGKQYEQYYTNHPIYESRIPALKGYEEQMIILRTKSCPDHVNWKELAKQVIEVKEADEA